MTPEAQEIKRLHQIIRERDREITELTTALENLIGAMGHMSPFGSDASVRNVRLAGKFMAALDRAKTSLARAAA
jgi:phage shock protein A